MTSLPFQFNESPDGTLRIKGIIQRAYNTRGAEGELFTQSDLEELSQLIIRNPAIAEHGRDPRFKATVLGEVTKARIHGRDLKITTEVPPPPRTPKEIYDLAREQFRAGKWKAYSIRWFAKNDPTTKRPDPNRRLPLEVSFCEEPRFGYARFTSVTASANPNTVLTRGQPASTHKSRAMSVTKDALYEVLKLNNPELPPEFMDKLPVEEYEKIMLETTKRAITEKKELASKLKETNEFAINRRAGKARQIAEQFKGVVGEGEAEVFNKFLTEDLPKSDKWTTVHGVFKRVAGELARLESSDAVAPPTTSLAASAPKRQATAPDMEHEKSPAPGAKPVPNVIESYLNEAWGKFE